MAYALIVDSPADLAFHRMVTARLGAHQPGLIATFAGETGTGLRVISVWESRADADRFFAEKLGPLLDEVVGPNRGGPQVSELDVQDYRLAPAAASAR